MDSIGINWAAIWNSAIWNSAIWAQTSDSDSKGGGYAFTRFFTDFSPRL